RIFACDQALTPTRQESSHGFVLGGSRGGSLQVQQDTIHIEFPVSGYEVTALVHNGKRSMVVRARNTTTGERVLLKALSEDGISPPDAIAETKREFEVTARLCQVVPGVVRAHELLWVGNRCCIVFEDIGGESLARIMKTTSLDLVTSLRLWARIAVILDGIH